MLDIYTGEPISMTFDKNTQKLKEYESSDKYKELAWGLKLLKDNFKVEIITASSPIQDTKQTKEDPKIISDPDIGFMQHPVGQYLLHNGGCCSVMATAIDEHLEDFGINYRDVCFAVQGSSGAIVGAFIAREFPESIIWDIKKPGVISHSDHAYNAPRPEKYIIFVDDFVSSGSTFERVYDAIKLCGRVMNCIAVSGRLSWTIFENRPVDCIICQEYNESI